MREPQEIVDEEHEQVIERVAAIDVAKASGMVCVRVPHESKPGRRGAVPARPRPRPAGDHGIPAYRPGAASAHRVAGDRAGTAVLPVRVLRPGAGFHRARTQGDEAAGLSLPPRDPRAAMTAAPAGAYDADVIILALDRAEETEQGIAS